MHGAGAGVVGDGGIADADVDHAVGRGHINEGPGIDEAEAIHATDDFPTFGDIDGEGLFEVIADGDPSGLLLGEGGGGPDKSDECGFLQEMPFWETWIPILSRCGFEDKYGWMEDKGKKREGWKSR